MDRSIYRTLTLTINLVSFLFLTSCINETVQEGKTIFQYETWVGLTSLVGSICICIVGLIGVLTTSFPKSFGCWLCLIIGPGLLFGLVPGLFTDQLVVSSNGFTTENQQEIIFEETSKISIKKRGDNKKAGYNLHFVMKDGKKRIVKSTDLIVEALPIITKKAQTQGVEVQRLAD